MSDTFEIRNCDQFIEAIASYRSLLIDRVRSDPTLPKGWLDAFLNHVPTPETAKQDYDYGAWFVESEGSGIGVKEMMEDYPKVCLREDRMRGYYDAWKRRGYAKPPW